MANPNNTFKYDIKQNLSFDSNLETNICTSIEMAKVVNSFFRSIFPDYAGCQLKIANGSTPMEQEFANYGSIYVNLFFTDKTPYIADVEDADTITKEDGTVETKKKGFKKGINPKKNIFNIAIKAEKEKEIKSGNVSKNSAENNAPVNKMLARYSAVAGIGKNTGRSYEVSHDTYDMLRDFYPDNKNPNIKLLTTETDLGFSPNNSKNEVTVCIIGCDLIKILETVYGTKTEEGIFQYQAIPCSVIPSSTSEFVMQVMKLNTAVVSELADALKINSRFSPAYHSAI